MRKFALVILDLEDMVIDRYNLDLVTAPSGLGFKLNMSTLSGDIEDVITKVSQAKNVIKFTVNQYQNSYSKANSLSLWIQKYSKPEYTMALEYNDGNIVRYCEGRVTGLGKTELDMTKILPQEFEFTQTTPFFVKRENTIVIKVASVGKSYPFKYPYSYGRNEVTNNEINNQYIYDAPLVITINGAITSPRIQLLNENNNVYNEVGFTGQTLIDNESIVINSAQKKIYKKGINGSQTDYRPEVDPQWDTFLNARYGKSTINIADTSTASNKFSIIGSWREYRL